MLPFVPRLLLLFAIAVPVIRASCSSYIGAVVEYRPVTEGKDGRIVAEINAARVNTIVKKAAQYDVDIVVFPEIGITSLPINRTWSTERIREHYRYFASSIPDPKRNVVLCDQGDEYSKSLRSISCTAKNNKIYVVVNHHEKVEEENNLILYNTNVVFDRRGRLIARYRKYNLFSEPGINITSEPEISIFNTDFGVTFGQIICNDILYGRPALELIDNVSNLVYSAEWFSELPFLTSVQTHSGWAYANNVNLLSAGFNEPAITNGGSGIYLGRRGVVKATIPNDSANVLVISEIPKLVNGSCQPIGKLRNPIVYTFSQDEIPTSWDTTEKFIYKDDFSLYTTEIVDLNRSIYNKTICNRGLCCQFDLDITFDKNIAKVDNARYYRYRLGVFNGVRLFAGYLTVGIEVCGLFFCRNDTLASCGERYSVNTKIVHPTKFQSIVIKRSSNDDPQIFHWPATLTDNLLPIEASKINENVVKNGASKSITLSLTSNEEKLLTFAIYGRNLAKDGTELTKL